MLMLATFVIPLGLLHLQPLYVWSNSLQLDPFRHCHSHGQIVVTRSCVCAL